MFDIDCGLGLYIHLKTIDVIKMGYAGWLSFVSENPTYIGFLEKKLNHNF